MKSLKYRLFSVIFLIMIVSIIPAVLLITGFCIEPQFDETYYGELSYMYRRLKETDEKKIIIIGNSAVPFGVRPDLMEEYLPEYKVVNFGLYGLIGTKQMLELSKCNINAEDIVIVVPEQDSHALSLFFSGEDMWMAADSCYEMLSYISREDIPSMVGCFNIYASDKLSYWLRQRKPEVSGVYTQAAFLDDSGEETGYIVYDRPYNTLPGGFDVNNEISFNTDSISEDFIEYFNTYCEYVRSLGADVYFGFAPMNRLALDEAVSAESIQAYYDYLAENLHCEILGNPANYIFDYEWFYNSNMHLNSPGMYVYTYRLIEDMKSKYGISTVTDLEMPEKPVIPVTQLADGNNIDADCFTYEERDEGTVITGLTDAGKQRTSLTIPSTYNGNNIISFTADAFSGNSTICEITIPENIKILYDGSFVGCTRLTKLIIQHNSPNGCSVGTSLLDGTSNCTIYVQAAVVDSFRTHYNWGAYKDMTQAYS